MEVATNKSFANRKSISYILGGVTFVLILLRMKSVTLPYFIGSLVGWVLAVVTLQVILHFLIKKFSKDKNVSHIVALNIALVIYIIIFIFSGLVQNHSNSDFNPVSNVIPINEAPSAISTNSSGPLDGQTTTAAQQELQSIIEKVGQLVSLPNGEVPVLATVNDAIKLVLTQPFYKDAQNGDVVLVYSQAKQAFLYDPNKNIIVNVGPLITNTANIDSPGLCPSGFVWLGTFDNNGKPNCGCEDGYVVVPRGPIGDVKYICTQIKTECDSDACLYDGKCYAKPVHGHCVTNNLNHNWTCDAGYVQEYEDCVGWLTKVKDDAKRLINSN
ncbi:MAG: hypothetical protein WC526_02320 [Patescibacteria group bacterium]